MYGAASWVVPMLIRTSTVESRLLTTARSGKRRHHVARRDGGGGDSNWIGLRGTEGADCTVPEVNRNIGPLLSLTAISAWMPWSKLATAMPVKLEVLLVEDQEPAAGKLAGVLPVP